MTAVIHPGRVAAYARGDLAERMVYVAWGMARMVRDEDAESIGEFLDTLTTEEKDALLRVQAAMIPVGTATPDQLLAWVTWDEFGCSLAGASSPHDPAPGMAASRVYQDCGTMKAYWRHRRAGHSTALVEACGCAQAQRDHYNARYAARKAGNVAAVARKSRTEARIGDYAERRQTGDSIGEAAARLGISRRTAERYEATLKARRAEARRAA